MGIEFVKIEDLKFDLLTTLMLIKSDEFLFSIYSEKIETPINISVSLIKLNHSLSKENKEYIFEIFDKVILTNEKYCESYKNLLSLNKPKKNKKLPRRYGKEKIMKDVQNQGFPATSLQRTLIDVYELRNIHVKLADRCISDMFGDTPKHFTSEDCRKISAIIKTLQNQVNIIIKKQK